MGGEVDIPALVGGGYGAFWNCRKRYRAVKGGKASKKSCTAALWYIYHLMRLPGANLLVVRAVQRTHRDSTFAQLRWAIRRLGVEHLWGASLEPLMLWYKPTGQRILFRGFDSAEKLASTTVETGALCWVWVEEAYEIAAEEEFDKLDLSAPRGRVEPPLFKQTTLTFNPWDGRHWLKARFFDHPGEDVLAVTTDYRGNEFLDETDRAVFAAMKARQPRRYAVAGLGEWGVTEGLVFERWEVAPFDERALPAAYRRVFGLDYGYANDPTAFIAAAVSPADKRLYVYDEHYQVRMLNSDIAAMLRAKGAAKERIRADSAEPKSNEELRRLGITRLRAAVKGPDFIRSGIARLQEYDMVIHPRCVHTARELAGYAWETGRDGRPSGRPIDSGNHLMDALRYAMADVPAVDRQPGRVEAGRLIRPEDVAGGWG